MCAITAGHQARKITPSQFRGSTKYNAWVAIGIDIENSRLIRVIEVNLLIENAERGSACDIAVLIVS